MKNEPNEFKEENNKETGTTKEDPIIVPETPKKRANKGLIALLAVGAVVVVVAVLAVAVAVVVYLSRLEPDSDLKRNDSTKSSANETIKATETEGSKHFSVEDASILPDNGDKVALSTIAIASSVSPATVSIIAEVSYGSVYGESLYESSGSGFIVSSDGYIVTNNHVVSGAGKVSVVIPGFEDPFVAKIIGIDAQTDIAVLKVESSDSFKFITFGDSDLLQVGELAVAIGNPFGELAGTVTVGVISALDREISIESVKYNLLQTDASINSGNSGGPLVNSYGEVIGVTNAKISDGEGIGFAIPINDVKGIIEELINNGYVSGRPIMGVVVAEVDELTAQQYDWPVGVYVREITGGGPAEKAGLQIRDIITEINGQKITSSQSVIDIRDHMIIGDTMELTVFRDGETISLTLVLEEGKAN